MSEHDGKTRTIPEYAARLRVSTSKIRIWLNEGSLIGTDVSSKASSRPQVVFTPEQQIAFEKLRATEQQANTSERRRRLSRTSHRRFRVGGTGEHIEI
jgi:transposase